MGVWEHRPVLPISRSPILLLLIFIVRNAHLHMSDSYAFFVR